MRHTRTTAKVFLTLLSVALLLGALAPTNAPVFPPACAQDAPAPKDDKDAKELENRVKAERARLEAQLREKKESEEKARRERLEANRPARPGRGGATTQTAPTAGPHGSPPAAAGPPAAAPPAGAPAPAAEGAPPVTPAQPPAPLASAPRRVTPPVVLMLKPYTQTVAQGARFETQAILYSEQHETFDKVALHVVYDGYLVRPLRIFDYPIRSADRNGGVPGAGAGAAGDSSADTPTTFLLNGRTVLAYSASLPSPQKVMGEAPLMHIVWEALRPSALLSLDLGAPGHESGVYMGERNLLHATMLSANAIVGAQVQIASPQAGKKSLFETPSRTGLQGASAAKPAFAEGIALQLIGPPKPPAPGEVFIVEVGIRNPGHLALDSLRLLVGFDPARAEVLDWDTHNLIRSGVNVLDGHARRSYPFDILRRNEADNRSGRIYYHMGCSTPRIFPDGVVVRIRARALSAGAVGSFTLFPGDAPPLLVTDILRAGRSILESPRNPRARIVSSIP